MRSKGIRAGATALLLLLIFGLLFHYKVHFDWHVLWLQYHQIDALRVCYGIVLIYISVSLRARRWTLLLRPVKKVAAAGLIGPQFIGFTCVALIGSLGDLVRPYLMSRRLQLPLSSQLATYTVERMFDITAAALLFSSALALSPADGRAQHRDVLLHVGVLSLVATVFLILLAVMIRRYGETLAAQAERLLGRISPEFGASVAAKIRSFREGLHTITTVASFFGVLALSLVIWGLVAVAYVQVVHSFSHTPQLAALDFSQTMLLVAAGIGGSLVQLPIVGWFTQIAATAAMMHTVFGVPIETATACGALLLGVTFIFLIPAGLGFAYFEGFPSAM